MGSVLVAGIACVVACGFFGFPVEVRGERVLAGAVVFVGFE